ncbi:MAG: DUF819 family protein [Candidatus Omnitrophota bacterium]|nr:DUF819 family protein [Candidatus Omnitrophota bacterium]
MSEAWSLAFLAAIVVTVVGASRQDIFRGLFRWLPIPLWCYLLPLAAQALGWISPDPAIYSALTTHLLPLALGCLLLGADLPSFLRTGRPAVMAMAIGALGVVIGTPLGVWCLQRALGPEAWKGAGALAATWTGGTMNLLAVRTILATPDTLFASLVVVDAVVAYGWMACLVAASGFREPLNRWLRASSAMHPAPGGSEATASSGAAQLPSRHGTALHCLFTPRNHGSATEARRRLLKDFSVSLWNSVASVVSRGNVEHYTRHLRALIACGVSALGLTVAARLAAAHLPASRFVSSATGWTVLLVTTAALGLSLLPAVRRIAERGGAVGYPCLYLVLAATGAQASLQALWSAPAWLLVGAATLLLHGLLLLVAGRLARIPFGVLATASQANVGGLVSAPLVGALYHTSLAPVGLLLAMAGNAVGTYLGLFSAGLCRWLLGGAP